MEITKYKNTTLWLISDFLEQGDHLITKTFPTRRVQGISRGPHSSFALQHWY